MAKKDDQDKPDGDLLLQEVERVLRKHCVMPSDHYYVATTLWIAATHVIHEWDHAPRLAIISPQKRCGKTRVMEVARAFVWSPEYTADATPAALFRMTNSNRPPTILNDEA